MTVEVRVAVDEMSEPIRRHLTRAEVLDRLGVAAERRPEAGFARLAQDFSADRELCPSGLIDSSVLPLLGVEASSDRLKAPPFAGGVQDQPNNILQAVAVVSLRRAFHQRREYDRMVAEAKTRA